MIEKAVCIKFSEPFALLMFLNNMKRIDRLLKNSEIAREHAKFLTHRLPTTIKHLPAAQASDAIIFDLLPVIFFCLLFCVYFF